jgi:hypothetical protein
LVDFWVQYGMAGVLDKNYVHGSFYSVVSSFTDMAPDSRRIKRRRDNVYKNSSNYFFKSFAGDVLKDNNFIVFNNTLNPQQNLCFLPTDYYNGKKIEI